MKKISSITIIGFLVLLVASPYISVYREWKSYFLMLAGLTIVILSFLIRRELHKVIRIFREAEEVKTDTYAENNPQ